MIDRDRTIKEFGYDPDDLSNGSDRKIWAICDDCKLERIITFRFYREFCPSCRRKGKGNHRFGIPKEQCPNWKGGRKIASKRNRSRRSNILDSSPIELNKDFKGSHGHHVNNKYIINIPSKIHNSMYHRQTDGMGMHNVNKLAFKYLIDNKEDMIVSMETAYYINLMCL